MSREIPRLRGLSANSVAMRLGAAGVHVIRLRQDTKTPLGEERWSRVSTTDPAVITTWFADDEYSVGIDLARSGLLCFDVDNPDKVPHGLRIALEQYPTAFQSTRSNVPGRGHHIYWAGHDHMIGSGYPIGWNTGWGEVKGWNTQISVGPVHQKRAQGGRYLFLRRQIAPLPRVLRNVLKPYNDLSATACDVSAGNGAALPRAKDKPCELMAVEVELAPLRRSRQDLLRSQLLIASMAIAGHPGSHAARMAVRRQWPRFRSDPDPRKWSPDEEKAWARAIALATKNRDKVCEDHPKCVGD